MKTGKIDIIASGTAAQQHSDGEVRFLIKELATGKLSTELAQNPVSMEVAHNIPLAGGYVWVRVITTYTEVAK